MKIQKIPRNKWLGIASAVLGAGVLLTAVSTFEYVSGGIAFIAGLILWWINR